MPLDPSLPFAGGPSSKKRLEPEYEDVYKAWKTKETPQTRAALLNKLSPVLDTAIQSYGSGSGSALRGQARRMALQALPSYDPARGSLRTHMLSQLRGLYRAGAQSQNIISVPEQVALDRNKIVSAETELRDRLGREPSSQEVASMVGISLKRLAHVRGSRGSVADSQVTDPLTGNMPSATPIQKPTDAWLNFVYHDLGPHDQVIMDHALGLHGTQQMGTSAIAKKLGITPGAVSQRLSLIQSRLDEMQDRGF